MPLCMLHVFHIFEWYKKIKINLAFQHASYACYMSFTHLSGTVSVWEHFFLFPVEMILIGVKNGGFTGVCRKKKVHLKNMFNVSKQLCFFLAQG